MKSALLRKTWALVFGIASLINCVAQEIDIAYVRIGAPAADGDSICDCLELVDTDKRVDGERMGRFRGQEP